MGAVDFTDMQLSFTDFPRKTMKWYKKLFFHLLEITVFNSYIAYKNCERKSELSLRDFKLMLIEEIFNVHSATTSSSRAENPIEVTRLTGRHFPVIISDVTPSRSRCVVCASSKRSAKKDSKPNVKCDVCGTTLCPIGCSKAFHTLKDF